MAKAETIKKTAVVLPLFPMGFRQGFCTPKPKLSEEAKMLYDAFAGGGVVTYGSVKEVLGVDLYTNVRAWNELVNAGLAIGAPHHAEMGRVYKEPR